jgi:4-carboxymuconolactone decarboxylase
MIENDGFRAGLKVRREVLGDSYVDQALAKATDFNRDMQQMVTEHGWGAVWTRPGLAKRDRSLLCLAMLTALNRPHELKLHVRGALNNGVTRDEIKEVFLQATLYCGAPAAIDAFRMAAEVFSELDLDSK